MLLFNPVVISVLIMSALCLLKVNVLLAILLSALVAGLTAGMPMGETMSVLISGMGGNSETALSYILLGALAVAINKTGLATILAKKISKSIKGKAVVLTLIIAAIGCFSQNLIPVHIAFIPILIPPLLPLMNQLKLDRRAMACALTFSVKAPYVTLSVGFGLIFHNIIRDQMIQNGVPITTPEITGVMWIAGLSMLIGLLLAVLVVYRKPREYSDKLVDQFENDEDLKMGTQQYMALVAAAIAFGVQIIFKSLPLGALAALTIMVLTGAIKFKDIDEMMDGGMKLMGFIAFVMLVAAGYGKVLRELELLKHW